MLAIVRAPLECNVIEARMLLQPASVLLQTLRQLHSKNVVLRIRRVIGVWPELEKLNVAYLGRNKIGDNSDMNDRYETLRLCGYLGHLPPAPLRLDRFRRDNKHNSVSLPD